MKDIFEGEISGVSKVALISNDVAYSKDLSVVKITGEEYYKLVADEKTNPSALYVVDDLHLNAYDQTIRNVASPELSDDAANKNYVDSEISKTKEYIVDKMVVPSQESPGYAANAVNADKVKNYSETLLSGLTEDDVPVSFYILTKN